MARCESFCRLFLETEQTREYYEERCKLCKEINAPEIARALRIAAVVDEYSDVTGGPPGNNEYWWGKFLKAMDG